MYARITSPNHIERHEKTGLLRVRIDVFLEPSDPLYASQHVVVDGVERDNPVLCVWTQADEDATDKDFEDMKASLVAEAMRTCRECEKAGLADFDHRLMKREYKLPPKAIRDGKLVDLPSALRVSHKAQGKAIIARAKRGSGWTPERVESARAALVDTGAEWQL